MQALKPGAACRRGARIQTAPRLALRSFVDSESEAGQMINAASESAVPLPSHWPGDENDLRVMD